MALLQLFKGSIFKTRADILKLCSASVHNSSDIPENLLKKIQQSRKEDDLPVEMENPFTEEKPQCILCKYNVDPNFRNIRLLSQFVSSFTGRIYGRHITGLCLYKHELVKKEIKKAQAAGLMGVYVKDPNFLADPDLYDPSKPYKHKKFICESQDKESEVIFIGDSLIQYLQLTSVWMKWFVPMHSLNFGIGGEGTQHLLWRVINGEFDYCKPKAIVVLIGTNNHGNTPQEIAEGIIEVAKKIREKQPESYIVLLELLPRGKYANPNRERNEKVNQIIRISAKCIPKCEVLNVGKDLVQPNGEIDDRDMFDYLHLTAAGYEKVFEPVYELLTQFFTEGEPEPDLDKILQD